MRPWWLKDARNRWVRRRRPLLTGGESSRFQNASAAYDALPNAFGFILRALLAVTTGLIAAAIVHRLVSETERFLASAVLSPSVGLVVGFCVFRVDLWPPDARAVSELLARHETCLACGYDLTGIP